MTNEAQCRLCAFCGTYTNEEPCASCSYGSEFVAPSDRIEQLETANARLKSELEAERAKQEASSERP